MGYPRWNSRRDWNELLYKVVEVGLNNVSLTDLEGIPVKRKYKKTDLLVVNEVENKIEGDKMKKAKKKNKVSQSLAREGIDSRNLINPLSFFSLWITIITSSK